MSEVSTHNNKQDIEIAKLGVKVENLDKSFTKFISNDFHALQKNVIKTNEKVDSFKKWLIGLLGGMIVSLILLIVNLAK